MNMKKILLPALTAALLASAIPTFPCEISFAQGKMTAAVGREVHAVVTVVLEHRNCRVPIERTAVAGKGLTIVGTGAWQRVKADVYSLDITFVLNAAQGEIRVTRECDKKGVSEGVLKVTAL
jgi:hypothetical protein